MTQEISGFEYSIKYFDEAGMFLSSEPLKIEVIQTENREGDRDEASFQADEWAEANLEDNNAEEYEVTLENAY